MSNLQQPKVVKRINLGTRPMAVAVFDYHDPARPGEAVDFWQLTRSDTPTLTKMERSIQVMRGAHIVKLMQ